MKLQKLKEEKTITKLNIKDMFLTSLKMLTKMTLMILNMEDIQKKLSYHLLENHMRRKRIVFKSITMLLPLEPQLKLNMMLKRRLKEDQFSM